MLGEMAKLRERLLKAEERVEELEATNFALNTARDEAIAGCISTQEELNFCRSDTFKKNIIDDFKSLTTYHEEIDREARSFLDKGYVHIIRLLHPHFKDKSVLLRAFSTNFNNEACRKGADFVPFTAKEMDALRERGEKRGRPFWNPPTPCKPTFWDMLKGPSSAP